MATSFVFLFLLLLSGCSAGPRNFENVNDQLRRENMELQRQVASLEEAIELRLAQIDALQQQVEHEPPALEGAEPPQFTAIALGRYGGVLDTDRDGVDDTLRVYVRPLDQHGRFVPVTGRAQIQAVAVVPGQQPVVLAERTFEPAEFSAAYRSGFTGTHYTLETPLTAPAPRGVDRATVVVRFTEAQSGVTVTREAVVPIRAPRRAKPPAAAE